MNEAILSRNHVKVKGSGKASIMFAPGFGCDQSVGMPWHLPLKKIIV